MRSIAPATTILLAVAGGTFLGLFSCGGYLWHRQLFDFLILAGVVISLVMPPRWMRNLPRKVGFVATVLILFVVVQALASSFYPSAPADARALWHGFLAGLNTGPC